MMTQAGLWATAGGATLLMIVAAFADWRRSRRAHLDRVGWVPWTFIQIVGLLSAMAAAALALKL
jgi:hypothetical protein